MQCIRCGAEINEGMAFCPTCGAAQNAAPNIEDGRIDNTPQSQQQPYEQQQPYGQQQYQQQPYEQPYEQQQPYGQQQYQQQQPYGQQQYQQPIQQQGWTQNNVQGMTDMQKKKKSKKPLIVSLVAVVLIIIGLTVTGIVLINSNKSTPEKTVEGFLDAMIAMAARNDYSEAIDEYIYPPNASERAKRDIEAIFAHSDYSYDNMSSRKLSSSEINSINKKIDYDYVVTGENSVKVTVHIEEVSSGSGCHAIFIVADIDGRWYIIDWLFG